MKLVAVDLRNTENTEELFSGPHTEIDVAPNGEAVAFCTARSHTAMNLVVLHLVPPGNDRGLPTKVGDGVPQLITDGKGKFHIHNGGWSFDSKSIVFTHDTDIGDIYELVPGK